MAEIVTRLLRRGVSTLLLLAMLGMTVPVTVTTVAAQERKAAASTRKGNKTKNGSKKESGKERRRRRGRGGEEGAEPTMADAIANATAVGRGHRDVKIPQFDSATGLRKSMIEVHSVERVDEVTLHMQGLMIQDYGPDGSEKMLIDVRSGEFDIKTGILIGEEFSRVVVPGQFEIIGAGLIYDTSEKEIDGKKVRAQTGKMIGPVKMIIFDNGKATLLSGGDPKKTAAATQAAAAATKKEKGKTKR